MRTSSHTLTIREKGSRGSCDPLEYHLYRRRLPIEAPDRPTDVWNLSDVVSARRSGVRTTCEPISRALDQRGAQRSDRCRAVTPEVGFKEALRLLCPQSNVPSFLPASPKRQTNA